MVQDYDRLSQCIACPYKPVQCYQRPTLRGCMTASSLSRTPFRCLSSNGWMSTFSICQKWRERPDRTKIPSVPGRFGIIVRPILRPNCSYVSDAHTYYDGCRAKKTRSWGPLHLHTMLSHHLKNGSAYVLNKTWVSGYNEILFASSYWNNNLPAVVEAFIVTSTAENDIESCRRGTDGRAICTQ